MCCRTSRPRCIAQDIAGADENPAVRLDQQCGRPSGRTIDVPTRPEGSIQRAIGIEPKQDGAGLSLADQENLAVRLDGRRPQRRPSAQVHNHFAALAKRGVQRAVRVEAHKTSGESLRPVPSQSPKQIVLPSASVPMADSWMFPASGAAMGKAEEPTIAAGVTDRSCRLSKGSNRKWCRYFELCFEAEWNRLVAIMRRTLPAIACVPRSFVQVNRGPLSLGPINLGRQRWQHVMPCGTKETRTRANGGPKRSFSRSARRIPTAWGGQAGRAQIGPAPPFLSQTQPGECHDCHTGQGRAAVVEKVGRHGPMLLGVFRQLGKDRLAGDARRIGRLGQRESV